MGNNEQTAIRLLKDLVSLQNGAPLERDKEEYDKLMNEIYSFLNDIADREIIESVFNSHSPTEPEFDTLQEGDCVYNLSREQVQQLLDISGDDWFVQPAFDGLVFSSNELYPIQLEYCSELEEYNFADFKQLCENTFGNQ